jgi:hypothetical protein
MKHLIRHPMSALLTVFLSLMLCANATAKTDVTGMWFTCLPKELGATSNPFELLRIKYVGKQILWTSEWGVGFSANGRGFRENDGLHLMGCHYLHGKVIGSCNVKNPPKHLYLAKQFFKAPANKAALEEAIAKRQPILTSAKRWDKLALACEAYVAKTQPIKVAPTATPTPAKPIPKPLPPRANEPRVNTAFPAYR